MFGRTGRIGSRLGMGEPGSGLRDPKLLRWALRGHQYLEGLLGGVSGAGGYLSVR
jgi:hypothetical protein